MSLGRISTKKLDFDHKMSMIQFFYYPTKLFLQIDFAFPQTEIFLVSEMVPVKVLHVKLQSRQPAILFCLLLRFFKMAWLRTHPVRPHSRQHVVFAKFWHSTIYLYHFLQVHLLPTMS